MPISEIELNSLITRRRAMSGESYEKAKQAVLAYLREQGKIDEQEYLRLKSGSAH
ncbi:MAG TPA: hypothetical protein VGK67_21570 [Myxococcales bacterium]|jgi:hypothetical protein